MFEWCESLCDIPDNHEESVIVTTGRFIGINCQCAPSLRNQRARRNQYQVLNWLLNSITWMASAKAMWRDAIAVQRFQKNRQLAFWLFSWNEHHFGANWIAHGTQLVHCLQRTPKLALTAKSGFSSFERIHPLSRMRSTANLYRRIAIFRSIDIVR